MRNAFKLILTTTDSSALLQMNYKNITFKGVFRVENIFMMSKLKSTNSNIFLLILQRTHRDLSCVVVHGVQECLVQTFSVWMGVQNTDTRRLSRKCQMTDDYVDSSVPNELFLSSLLLFLTLPYRPCACVLNTNRS